MWHIQIPIRTQTEANTGGHWAAKAKRAKEQRSITRLLLGSILPNQDFSKGYSFIVRLTRIAPRKLDSDNLQSATKHVRDGIADALGVDDGDPRYEWVYAQERHPSAYFVSVTISAEIEK